ncbi:MAG: cytochrome c oxidase subunit 3 [bacterium]
MTPSDPADLDLGELPVGALGSESLLWWGISGLIVVETIVFGTFLSSGFYLRVLQSGWPPPDVAPPGLSWASAITVLLAASVVTIRRATRIALQERRKPIAMLLTSVALATVCGLLRLLELDALPFSWKTHAFGSVFWTLNGLHMAHVSAAVLGTGAVAALVWRRPLGPKVVLATQVDGLYWQFMVIIWLPLYGVLYLVPRLS